MDSLSRHRFFVFFFNDTATTEIYTLSLHDALPIYPAPHNRRDLDGRGLAVELVNPSEGELVHILTVDLTQRSEEHTSELQSQSNLVCRLLLEKKKKKYILRLSQPRRVAIVLRLSHY